MEKDTLERGPHSLEYVLEPKIRRECRMGAECFNFLAQRAGGRGLDERHSNAQGLVSLDNLSDPLVMVGVRMRPNEQVDGVAVAIAKLEIRLQRRKHPDSINVQFATIDKNPAAPGERNRNGLSGVSPEHEYVEERTIDSRREGLDYWSHV